MGGFEAVIAHGAGGRKSDVDDGGPTLEFVVAVVVKQIGNADGCSGAGCFDGCEGRMIVDDVVGEKNFLAAAATHIQGREIIECTGSGNTRKEPVVGCVPKGMFGSRRGFRSGHRGGGHRGQGFGIRRGRRFLGEETLGAARVSEREQQYELNCADEWNCAQSIDSGPGSSIVVVFSHYGVRDYHRRVRVVFDLVCGGFFDEAAEQRLLPRYGWPLYPVVLVPHDAGAARSATG